MNINFMESIFKTIRQKLKQNSDPHTKATGQNFFKEKVKFHGVKIALVTKIAKQYDRDILAMPKKNVFALCEALWQSGYAASEVHQEQVFEYVMKNKTKMPCTALRYAIEKMPKDLKTKAMVK